MLTCLVVDDGLYGPFQEGILYLGDIGGGQREQDADRLHLGHDDQSVGVRGLDDIADVDHPYARNTVERCGQRRIAQLGVCVVDRGLIGFNRTLQLCNLIALVGHLLVSRKTTAEQWQVAIEVNLHIRKLGLVAAQLRLDLRKPRLIWSGIDLGEDVATMDLLAFNEVDRLQHPGDLAADRSGVQRLNGSQSAEDDRYVVLVHRNGHYGHRWRRRRGDRGRGTEELGTE